MQDIHSFESSGRGGRLFAGEGDRRLRPHDFQDLKCPRCESINTKFCYYNNYNLSQPRHFCKSCRRYWTKGGVLRNVPVGGGIRKPKRSNKPKSKTNTPSSDAVAAERKSSNSENSSSDSSNTTTPNTTVTTTTDVSVSGSNSTNSTPTMILNFNEPSRRFFNIPQSSIPKTTFDPLILNQSSAGNRSSEIETFTSMMTSSTDQLPGIPSFQPDQQKTEHVVENQNANPIRWTAETMGFMDQTAEIELPRYSSRRSNGELPATEDWQDNTDEGLFDLTGTVDHSYWNQTQWNDDDDDHHLNYLP